MKIKNIAIKYEGKKKKLLKGCTLIDVKNKAISININYIRYGKGTKDLWS